ncbi:hypothetical protein POM88_048555 [Heracleum sosnowskyi]|uniref:Transposase-associated domain-containing protein n=1 Tax=Heracleum sosnowskyi TaxID=360622 RepID=A0AAD8GVJ3_9APIA|nr:hypothetical protein POM88_048555 [Heracleum sosnowskyi]
MTSDHSWVGRHRYDESKYLTEEYKNGVDSFLKLAIDRLKDEDEGLIRCPCKKCGNEYYKYPSDVRLDLYLHGIMHWYTRWDLHGEKDVPRFETEMSTSNVGYNDDNMYDVRDMLRDFVDANAHFENFKEETNAKAKDFYKMVDNASIPIYPYNKESTLSVVNKLTESSFLI